MKRFFFTAKSVWQHTKLIFHRSLHMNCFCPSVLAKPWVWTERCKWFVSSVVCLTPFSACHHHHGFPKGGALVRHYSPGSNVHQNEIGSESLWLYGSLCILWSSFHSPYSIFPLYLFASSLYLCQPIVSLYSTLEDLRSPALAASVISHLHQLCVRRTYSISKAPLAMSTNASTEGETPVTSPHPVK